MINPRSKRHNKVPMEAVKHSRDLLVDQARIAKQALHNALASGTRDFDMVHKLMEAYIDYQTAADALGYEEVKHSVVCDACGNRQWGQANGAKHHNCGDTQS